MKMESGKINFVKMGNTFEAYCEYDKNFNNWLKTYGGARWNGEKRCWLLTVSGLVNFLTEVGNRWYNMDADVFAEVKADVEERKNEKLKEKEYWDTPVQQRLDAVEPIVNYVFKTLPYPHQVEAFNTILKWKKILIADEPGLGKTAESIYATDYLRKNGDVKKCLIICGVNTIKYNWLDETKKHCDQKAILIDGTEKKRLELIDEWKNSDDIYYAIINIEALRKETIFNALNGAAECIICDEIHKAKNSRSQQGHALMCMNAPYKIGLTGTPVDNKVEDLYNILSWLGNEKRRFVDFRDAYCNTDRWGKVTGYKNLQKLKDQLSRVMIRRKKEDVVDLPEKIHKTEYVELSTAESRKYKELKRGMLDNINKLIDMDNPLSSIFHLREVTSGLYTDIEDNAKLDRIREIVDEEIIPAKKKVLIFSKYEKVAEIYQEAFADYQPAYITGSVDTAQRQKEIEHFQNDENCKVCVGTIGAMGTGITLTAASTVIFADKEWTVSANRQAEDRAHRIGSTENINVITIVAKDTIDEYIEDILKDKELYTDLIMEGADVVLRNNRSAIISKLLGISEEELNAKIKKSKKKDRQMQKSA